MAQKEQKQTRVVRIDLEDYELLYELQQRTRQRAYRALPGDVGDATGATLGGLIGSGLRMLKAKFDEQDGIDAAKEAAG